MTVTSTVYLLHFEPAYRAPIGDTGRVKVAGHYLGSTAGTAKARLDEHLSGRGELFVPCRPHPEKLPKRSRDACDLERTIATLRIGATDDVQLSPDEAAYYFGPCEV